MEKLWENYKILAQNRLKARAYFIPYSDPPDCAQLQPRAVQ